MFLPQIKIKEHDFSFSSLLLAQLAATNFKFPIAAIWPWYDEPALDFLNFPLPSAETRASGFVLQEPVAHWRMMSLFIWSIIYKVKGLLIFPGVGCLTVCHLTCGVSVEKHLGWIFLSLKQGKPEAVVMITVRTLSPNSESRRYCSWRVRIYLECNMYPWNNKKVICSLKRKKYQTNYCHYDYWIDSSQKTVVFFCC